MSNEHQAYGWKTADKNDSHDFLVPTLSKHLGAVFGARRGRVLDLGCGNGYVTSRIAGLGHDVIGFDASADGIEVARAAYPGIDFKVASVYDEALPDVIGGEFDAVVSLEVVEHLFYPKRLFEQSYRLLRRGGTLIVSTPYHGYWKNLALAVLDGWDHHFHVDWDGGHIKFFSQRSIGAMARAAGFRSVRFDGAGRVPYLWKSMFLIAEK